MDLTTRSTQALSAAQHSAVAAGNPQLEPLHLLVALLDVELTGLDVLGRDAHRLEAVHHRAHALGVASERLARAGRLARHSRRDACEVGLRRNLARGRDRHRARLPGHRLRLSHRRHHHRHPCCHDPRHPGSPPKRTPPSGRLRHLPGCQCACRARHPIHPFPAAPTTSADRNPTRAAPEVHTPHPFGEDPTPTTRQPCGLSRASARLL